VAEGARVAVARGIVAVPFNAVVPIAGGGVQAPETTSGSAFQIFITELLDAGRLRTDEFGSGNREARLLGDGHRVSGGLAELFLEGGVLPDGFEELVEVFPGHGGRIRLV